MITKLAAFCHQKILDWKGYTLKPNLIIASLNLTHQRLGLTLSTYSDLSNLQTLSFSKLSLPTTPSGIRLKIPFSGSPFRKAVLTSICDVCKSKLVNADVVGDGMSYAVSINFLTRNVWFSPSESCMYLHSTFTLVSVLHFFSVIKSSKRLMIKSFFFLSPTRARLLAIVSTNGSSVTKQK